MGPSLRNASAKITKAARTAPARDGGRRQNQADPWADDKAGGYTLTGTAGTAVHTTPLTSTQAGILRDCQVTSPPRITALDPA